MANDCGCGFSIISKQPSLILSPLCAPTCSTDYGCWTTLPSGCIPWTGGDISSIGIVNGNNLNQVITQLVINSGIGNSCCVPLVWHNITLNEGFTTPSGAQKAQYAVDPANGKVWLRGTIDGNGQSNTNAIFTTLPIVPLFTRSFFNVFNKYSGSTIFNTYTVLTTAGVFSVAYSDSTPSLVTLICLDGLSYETN